MKLVRGGMRVGVVGATGALGTELLEVLGERHFPIAELLPVATDASLGAEVEIAGEVWPVETDAEPSLRGLDLLFLCLPEEAALGWVRRALQAEVPCFDLSGAAAATGQLPLLSADLGADAGSLRAPLVALPPGPALAWALVLAPLHASVGLTRVVGTSLESASSSGRTGVESLQAEVLALLNQRDAPESSVFPAPLAFDCVPNVGLGGDDADTAGESALARDLELMLGGDVALAITSVHVPTFAGVGATLALESQEPLSPETARALLEKTSGVELWEAELPGPTTREPIGRELVLVGRLRADPTRKGGLLLWLAADPVRLAAANAVRLAEARIGRH